MNNKIIYIVVIIVLLVGIFIIFPAVVNAKNLNLFCFKKQNIIVTLKNDANIDIAKKRILEIPQIKITNIKYRDKEWSRMVNKMDLPNMQNPFKNEFTIKPNKKANINEIYNQIKEMEFVENIEYVSDTKCLGKQNN